MSRRRRRAIRPIGSNGQPLDPDRLVASDFELLRKQFEAVVAAGQPLNPVYATRILFNVRQLKKEVAERLQTAQEALLYLTELEEYFASVENGPSET